MAIICRLYSRGYSVDNNSEADKRDKTEGESGEEGETAREQTRAPILIPAMFL